MIKTDFKKWILHNWMCYANFNWRMASWLGSRKKDYIYPFIVCWDCQNRGQQRKFCIMHANSNLKNYYHRLVQMFWKFKKKVWRIYKLIWFFTIFPKVVLKWIRITAWHNLQLFHHFIIKVFKSTSHFFKSSPKKFLTFWIQLFEKYFSFRG